MWRLSSKGASGFSSSSTAEEVTQGIDGSGLTAIVTGASSGIGTETVRVLALRGVHVVMAVRNMAACREVKKAIVKEIPNAKVQAMELDLSSLASVRKFASEFKSSECIVCNMEPCTERNYAFLSNNAGIMATPFMLSKDNIELQFATNHIGHFLLTNLLLETMGKTARESSKEGRIVNVSSRRHQFSYPEGIRFDRINDQSGYNRFSAYGQSKLANVLHTNELARRLKEDGVDITANSVHPGAITTNLFRNISFFSVAGLCQLYGPFRFDAGLVGLLGKYVIKNVEQGAATTCYVALHPHVKGLTGSYFADSNVAQASSQAVNTELAQKLWDFSSDLIYRCSQNS
ncbi:Short-chain dehydrogenase TIC 32 [Citrus sinensis]|uniref:Short-chain dehydrogenase TIC 32 n=1 Tax=Citrus sinensis TaxID=2711 RepID=A0ACB8HSM5_CITSI|nr:Short-chain dehydrogenase TIC 32 [Citrus sinensis]